MSNKAKGYVVPPIEEPSLVEAVELARREVSGVRLLTYELRNRSHRIEYEPGVDGAHLDRHHRTGEVIRSVLVDACVCHFCGAWLSLGPANDAPPEVQIEIALARLLAEHECIWEPCGAKDEADELVLDIFADTEPPPVVRGPRSPLEMMIDEACGISPIATHDSGGE